MCGAGGYQISIQIAGETSPIGVVADDNGNWAAGFSIPVDFGVGDHTVTVLCSDFDSFPYFTYPLADLTVVAALPTPTPTQLTSSGQGTDVQSVTTSVPNGGSITLLDSTNHAVSTLTVAGKGRYRLSGGSGRITFTPVLGYTGTPTPVHFRVTNSQDASGENTYAPTVTAPAGPQPPELRSTGVGTHPQHVTFSVPAGGSVTLLDATVPAIRVTVAGKGVFQIVDRTVTFMPLLGFTGPVTASYRVVDAYGQIGTARYLAEVTPPAAPLAVSATTTGRTGSAQTTVIRIPAGASMSLLSSNGVAVPRVTNSSGTYTLDRSTGVITFHPAPAFTGVAVPVAYRLTDAYGQTSTARYTPHVTAPVTATSVASGTTTLANTGADPLDLVGIAALLIASGAALASVRPLRRR